jgi:hypothetical protein
VTDFVVASDLKKLESAYNGINSILGKIDKMTLNNNVKQGGKGRQKKLR